MPVRGSMSQIITRVRFLIADTSGSPNFADQDVQDTLDECRDDVAYELLRARPSIVNTASTNNVAQLIWADYYSQYQWWESDVIVQGNVTNTPWEVLTPVGSDYITGHWQFELTPFVNGTVPGQYPPVWIAYGKTYDVYLAASKLLEVWAAQLASTNFDFSQDGTHLRLSQVVEGKAKLGELYRRKARPRTLRIRRDDHPSTGHGERIPILGNDSLFSGEGV